MNEEQPKRIRLGLLEFLLVVLGVLYGQLALDDSHMMLST